MNDEEFHDNTAIASFAARLQNPNLVAVDRRKMASASLQDADALLEQRDKGQVLSLVAREALNRNGGPER